MVTLTPEMAGDALWVMIIAYLLTFAYSIYSLILNRRQAKVKDVLLETNQTLKNIECLLKAKNKKVIKKQPGGDFPYDEIRTEGNKKVAG